MSALASVIRAWLDHNGKGQNELAYLAGIRTSTLSYLMNKEDALPRPDTLKSLARAMGINGAVLTELLGYPINGEGEPGERNLQIARQLQAFPWLIERLDDLLHLPESEFRELMKYLEFRRRQDAG